MKSPDSDSLPHRLLRLKAALVDLGGNPSHDAQRLASELGLWLQRPWVQALPLGELGGTLFGATY